MEDKKYDEDYCIYLEKQLDIREYTIKTQQQEIDRLNKIIKKKNKQINDMEKFYKDKIKRLNKIIDKAVEYIENNFIDYESAKAYITYDEMLEIPILDLRELLEILKGEK